MAMVVVTDNSRVFDESTSSLLPAYLVVLERGP